ncbi:MAG: hypothetical protein RL226_661, partial [Bacteroidota bacterium]
MSLQSFRERVNLFLYGHKDQVLTVAKFLSVVVTFSAIFTLVYYYGYPHNQEEEATLLRIIKGSFGFYVLYYLIRFIYDFKPIEFIRNTWFEGLIMAVLTIEGISYNLFDTLLLEKLFNSAGLTNFSDLSAIFIQLYFLAVILIGFGRSSDVIPRIKLNPALVFILTFIIIILFGAGLLMLPEMTTQSGSLNFIDALFSSTSATCVTGLMTLNTHTDFTFKGQMILLILMKLGGLNIIAFGSFLALAARFGIDTKQHSVIEDFVNKGTQLSAEGMLRKVVFWSLGIEVAGALGLFIFWDNAIPFASTSEKVFYSIFHSVSSFNNAGLSVFDNGFYAEIVRNNYYAHWIINGLVFLGALGMMAVFDLFDPGQLRDRMRNPWKRIQFSTKIALYYSIVLIVGGAALFLLTEGSNSLKDMSMFGKVTTSLFQSVNARSNGLNTVDYGIVSAPALFVIISLMFIGASSSSTGGGIKTSTLALLIGSALASIRGQEKTVLFKRTVSSTLLSRAIAVFIFFAALNVVGVFVLSLTEHSLLNSEQFGAIDMLFETVSAFG